MSWLIVVFLLLVLPLFLSSIDQFHTFLFGLDGSFPVQLVQSQFSVIVWWLFMHLFYVWLARVIASLGNMCFSIHFVQFIIVENMLQYLFVVFYLYIVLLYVCFHCLIGIQLGFDFLLFCIWIRKQWLKVRIIVNAKSTCLNRITINLLR